MGFALLNPSYGLTLVWFTRAVCRGNPVYNGVYEPIYRMTIPRPGQTVHLMSRLDVLRVRRDMHRKKGRNARELELYTTDDLRRLYQGTNDDLIRLRDGIVSRVELVAEIRWRIFWARFGYGLLLSVSVIAAVAAVIAAAEGWRAM
jgi:hypothetical protein